MWKTLASLSGIFPLKTTCKVGLHHKTPTLQFPRLVLYEPREPHPEERNTIDSNASLNWKIGYTIWTFHWRLCCSTKNITITAFIGSKTVEVAERLQRKTIAKKTPQKNSRPLIMGWDGRDVCPWCESQGERLHYHFPEYSGEFEIKWALGKVYLPVIVVGLVTMARSQHITKHNFIQEST